MTPQSDDHNTEEGDDHQLIRGLTKCVDTTASAIPCNTRQAGETKWLRHAGFATLCKPLQRLSDHS